MSAFLGIDGGGTKTEFVLVDAEGRVLARHAEGTAYYLEVGLEALHAMLARGIRATAARAALPVEALDFAFVGVPAHGEDSSLLEQLDALPAPTLNRSRFACGNDAVCGWAGALACQDGVNVVAGTGSIAYGEFQGRQARAGGWGELLGDEGSAHWIAREALNRFSRMSDGRAQRGELHRLIRQHYGVRYDLDLCAAIYGRGPGSRSKIAQLAPLVTEAAKQGDPIAREIFQAAVEELVALVSAARASLAVPAKMSLAVSGTGSLFALDELILQPFQRLLDASALASRWVTPRLSPAAGAAVYAAKLNRTPLSPEAIGKLSAQEEIQRPR